MSEVNATIKPTVHLNGTSAGSLVEQYNTAARAVWTALREVEGAGPNQRDYYPQGDLAWTRAKAQHDVRVQALRRVVNELREIADYVSEQQSERDHQRHVAPTMDALEDAAGQGRR